MRIGPRILGATVLASAVLCSPAWAADTLNVSVDNNQIALGAATTLAAHIDTDAAYGGGHLALQFKPADTDCAATPGADSGDDATGGQPIPVAAGAATSDIGGQQIQLDVGNWVVCGWLVDDSSGTVAATGSTVVQVVPYQGSLSMSVKRVGRVYQVVLSWSTSSAATLFAWMQPAAKDCPMSPARLPKAAVPIVPKGGRFVGSDGGLGHAVKAKLLRPGRWHMCGWLRALDVGSVGPVTKTFSVPRKRKHAVRVAG
jgi:hypothetical protein